MYRTVESPKTFPSLHLHYLPVFSTLRIYPHTIKMAPLKVRVRHSSEESAVACMRYQPPLPVLQAASLS